MSYMDELYLNLLEGRSVATAKEYMNRLIAAAGGDFVSLGFLHNHPQVLCNISHYAESTRKGIISAIVVTCRIKGWDHLAEIYFPTKIRERKKKEIVIEEPALIHIASVLSEATVCFN
jgi:hypothetical protein